MKNAQMEIFTLHITANMYPNVIIHGNTNFSCFLRAEGFTHFQFLLHCQRVFCKMFGISLGSSINPSRTYSKVYKENTTHPFSH